MQITELTITLLDTHPAVVRTVETPVTLSLENLHVTLQAAFGWDDAHLYQFCVGAPYQMDGMKWVSPHFQEPGEVATTDATLEQALQQSGQDGLTYLYDFGDDWVHDIQAGPVKKADPTKTYPRLTDVQNTCPPEDIGGAPGFHMFKEAMADPKHPEHAEMKDWFGGKYNPEKPKVKALQSAVAKVAKHIVI
ncbi:MAG: plasmid pRiA4b ORF-3 family protein [Pseudomonadota bacterium]